MWPQALVDGNARKQTRASLPKVRTGCSTCKGRRVKCDEQKPSCLRCASTGRECRGLGYGSDRSRLVAKMYEGYRDGSTHGPICCNITDLPGVDAREMDYLQFFRLQTAQDLPGLFRSELWERIIPQISHSEPAVLHASAALGALHQKCMMEGMTIPTQDMTNKLLQFALQQFNKSINLLQTRSTVTLTQGRTGGQILLMCCVLFISIEILRGHYGTAMFHLFKGRDILREHLRHTRQTTAEGVLVLLSKSQSIDDGLVEIFARLDIQSTSFGSNAPHFSLVTGDATTKAESDVSLPFASLIEARQNFDVLINAIWRFLTMSPDPAFHNPINPIAVTQQQNLCAELEGWSQSFESCMQRVRLSSKDVSQSTILRLHHKYLKIRLATSLNYGVETIYDRYIDDFGAMISLAEELTGNGHIPDQSSLTPPIARLPTFSLDIGIIQPLYFTALKCRLPQLRRRALAVLSSTPHREGMWDAALLSTVAARIIQLEETRLEITTSHSTEDLWPLLPEAARFCEVRVYILGEGADGAALYCKQRRSAAPSDEHVRQEYCAFDAGALVKEILAN